MTDAINQVLNPETWINLGPSGETYTAARAELAALRSENERLQTCMEKAGMIAFMRDGTPEEVAEHYKRIMDANDAENEAQSRQIAALREALTNVCHDSTGNLVGEGLLKSLGALDHSRPNSWAFSQGWVAWLTRHAQAVAEASSVLSSVPPSSMRLVPVDDINRLLEVVSDRWTSNPEIVLTETMAFAQRHIPEHPLANPHTMRDAMIAKTRATYRVVPVERLREIEDLLQEEHLCIPGWLAAAIAGDRV